MVSFRQAELVLDTARATQIFTGDVRQALVVGVGVHRGVVQAFDAEGVVQDLDDGHGAVGRY